jgi:hypothetical protein
MYQFEHLKIVGFFGNLFLEIVLYECGLDAKRLGDFM